MQIFIDESGNFVIPSEKKTKVSCVSALTIPDKYIDAIKKSFISLRTSWGHNEEIKGSNLTEKQISDTIALLCSYDVLLDIVCIDIGHHSSGNIEESKDAQAYKLIENLTDEHHNKFVEQVYEYSERLSGLPNQLYIQAEISIRLIERVLEQSPLYYCQRIPEELGNFVWFIDAKNSNTEKTPFEELWSTLLLPILESNFSMAILREGDYSHFKKYEVGTEELTDHHLSLITKRPLGGVDLKKLISEQLSFEDSQSQIGLQLVDILSAAFCRAMNDNLGIEGWRHLGSLMVHIPSVALFAPAKDNNPVLEKNHSLVLTRIRRKLKSIIASHMKSKKV